MRGERTLLYQKYLDPIAYLTHAYGRIEGTWKIAAWQIVNVGDEANAKKSLKSGFAFEREDDDDDGDDDEDILGTKRSKKHFSFFFQDRSVTRFGDFLKFLATKFLAKEAQMIGNFLGYFEKPHSYVKTALATFWATFGKNYLLLIPTSGHTAGWDDGR